MNPAKAPWYFLWLQELVSDTTFTLAGFNTFKRDGVTISGTLVTSIDAELRVGAGARVVSVVPEEASLEQVYLRLLREGSPS